MTSILRTKRPVLLALVVALAAGAAPLHAQSADVAGTDARLRKVEAEVRALQRTVFPGGDGKYFPPQVEPNQPAQAVAGTPASTPVTDLLARMDSVEKQLTRLTAQTEENTNKIGLIEARLNTLAPPAPAVAGPALDVTPTPAPAPSVTQGNLAAMTAASPAKPATTDKPATPAAKPAAAAAKPAAKPAAPSAQRLAAVKAIEKPVTKDPGDDEYSYGYRLYDAKFYPEAEQQLKMFLQKYPKHARVSYARNLLGRAYLDEGNTDEATKWFVENYTKDKAGDRAPDSLLYLAETMRQRKDSKRACIALQEFAQSYPRDAGARLKAQYDATRAGVKCN